MVMIAQRTQGAKPSSLSVGLDKYQLFILACSSFIVALIGMGTPGIGFDEAATWWAGNLDWPELGRLLGNQDRNFGPYYAIMHIWMDVSDSLWWLRLPSAVGGALSVVATAGLCRHFFGARAAWIAALLMILAYSWVRFSQEVRPYSWSLAIATFGTWAFVILTGRYSRKVAAIYLALMLVLPVTHLFAGMVAGVHLLYALACRDRRMALLAVIGAVPSLLAAGLVVGQVKQVSWLSVVTPLEVIRELVGQSKAVWYLPVALAACAGLVLYRWAAKEGGTRAAELTLFISWWVAPPAFLWAASVAITPVYSARYVFWTIPAMVIPAALLIARLFDVAKVRVLLVVAMTSFVGLAVPGQFSARASNGHVWAPQDLASVIIEGSQPGDALVAPDFLALTLQYHLRHDALPEPLVARTAEVEGKFMDVQAPTDQQTERLRDYSRLWVLDQIIEEPPLPTGFCPLESWISDYRIARLTLAIRCDPPAAPDPTSAGGGRS